MTDQTPEARLAAALYAALRDTDTTQFYGSDSPMDDFSAAVLEAILAADPTLICPDPAAHALVTALKRLQEQRASFTLDWHPNAWLVTVRATPPSKGVADTLDAAIEEALRDDRR